MATFKDLREYIDEVDRLGELKTVRGADWNLEVGGITEYAAHRRNGPAVLFDDVKGYPSGFRVFSNSMGSANRSALVLGLPTGKSYKELLPIWKQRMSQVTPVPPQEVPDGPVMENVIRGDDVNMLSFPTPLWHEGDGGRYLGTGVAVIIRDPDSDWVNLGSYRVMVKDEKRLGLYISPGKHGRIMREKYFARGEKMPVAMSFGHDPTVFLASSVEVPYGLSEYAYAGGVKDMPLEVIKGPVTGLPIPARAEIVVEGFISPGDTDEEGPFGEWTGYYASGHRAEPMLRVEAIYHRNNPIILGSPPHKPPSELTAYRSLMRSALIWEQVEKAGVPDVTEVWAHEVGGARLLVALAIKQRYNGHARQAAHAAMACHAGNYAGRLIVVTDEDIDVTDLDDVMWAVCTRCDPAEDLDIVKKAWSTPLDPRIPPWDRERKNFTNSRLIIDATRPFEWRDEFPAVAEMSPGMKKRIEEQWGEFLLSPGSSVKSANGRVAGQRAGSRA
jgi:4-hydroxy-3-polyprenylbenzoate decarboxylase